MTGSPAGWVMRMPGPGPDVARSHRNPERNPGGTFTVEQQAFCDLSDGKIIWLRLLCSGFVPLEGTQS
jgi:hypothetical protein